MKRRNVDLSKLRRPMKSKKVSEGTYSSVFGYAKFLAVWGLVLLADFILEFRFEYLYPVWLLLRTVQDSYKYQGVLLTMLFVAIAMATDIFCYVFIPVQWLFFAASSYVWVQYVWHTDRGICLSSVSLWLLFVYVEAALRMKDQKALPFNMDLCRPFAAHCIGYPVVTLGYGIKTAASESIRRRTRTKVKKSNHFYHQLLQEALPIELQESSKLAETDLDDDFTSESTEHKKDSKDDGSDSSSETSSDISTVKSDSTTTVSSSDKSISHTNNSSQPANNHKPPTTDHQKSTYIEDFDVSAEHEARVLHRKNINDLSEETENALNDSKTNKVANKDNVSKKVNNKKNKNTSSTAQPLPQNGTTAPPTMTNGHVITANGDSPAVKSDLVIRLESDIKRLKADLQASRNTESELRSQLNSKTNDDRQKKATLTQLQQDNDTLQNKLHNLVMSRQEDKQKLAALEKKLQEEKKLREKSEQQLTSERKSKKQEEQLAARAAALANANRGGECGGSCKSKLKEMEDDLSKIKWDVNRKDEQIRQLEVDSQKLRNYKDTHNHEVLMSALTAMQDKTSHLENSLSAETKIKMDLFSALGEVKRQLEIQRHMLAAKDTEISGLRSHITDALALVPSSMYGDTPIMSGQYTTPKLGSPTMANTSQASYLSQHDIMFSQRAMSPPSAHRNMMGSRFSPTNHNNMSEPGSPSRTPVSEADHNAMSALNPKAKDYQPGAQTN